MKRFSDIKRYKVLEKKVQRIRKVDCNIEQEMKYGLNDLVPTRYTSSIKKKSLG